MALSTRRTLLVIAAVALGTALAFTFTSLVPSADSSPAEAAKKKRKKKKKRMYVSTSCKTEHTPFPPVGTGEDFVHYDLTVQRQTKAKRSRAAARVGLKGAKVTGKLKDLTPAGGDNAIVKQDSDTVGGGPGEAELLFEFNNFGDYEVSWKVTKKGYRTKRGKTKFHVTDRTSGPCDVF